MYLEHFELNEKPFLLNTDPRFLWLGPVHQEALATLCYGLRENKGLLLLTGDIGTGKTTLISALMDWHKDETVLVARMPDPGRNRNEFYFLVAHSFGIQARVHDKESFIKAMGRHLVSLQEEGKRALLIIDEAQMMNQEILEEVRLLSNLEFNNAKLLNIFLLGQNELNQLLREPRNRAIRERITISYNLLPLSKDETKAYIGHRLQVAGAKTSIFTPDAVRAIHAYSNGSVRIINILCDLALVFGFDENKTRIDEEAIEFCKAHLSLPAQKVPFSNAFLAAKSPAGHKTLPSLVTLIKHTTRTERTILFALLILLSGGYLLFAGMNRDPIPVEPGVSHKIPNPSRETSAQHLQQPSSVIVEKSSFGLDPLKSPAEKEPSAIETLGQPEDTEPDPADKTANNTTEAGPGRKQEMQPPNKRTTTPDLNETGNRQIIGADPQPDENKTSPPEESTRQTAAPHRSPSEPPDPAAIIDWLMREKQKNNDKLSR